MSLIFRMFYVWLRSLRLPSLPVGQAESRIKLRTLPNDLDLNFHMNNGRYLTICDLNRVDLFIRIGLARLMIKKGWAPIISEHTMQYRRPLKLWQRFEARMQLTHWDDKSFYMTHQFMSGEKLIAEGTSTGVVRGKEGVIAPADVIAALHVHRSLPHVDGDNTTAL